MSAPSPTPASEWSWADRPISDRAADRLGRRSFSEALALAVKGWRGKDSLVIALYGPWGIGKSSIKNMAVEALTAGPTPLVEVVDFNPWQVAKRAHISEVFFDEIGIALGKDEVATKERRNQLLNRWRRYAARLRESSGLLKVLTQPLRWVLLISGIAMLVGALVNLRWLYLTIGMSLLLVGGLLWLSKVAEYIVALLEVGVVTGRKSLAEVKKDLAQELRRLSQPLLVVVDDIDRLTPSELQEVFQLVKANGDLPNLVYLLLCDRPVIESHIKEVMKIDGRDYLEKIVQVAFDVPAIERPRLQNILFQGLNGLLEDAAVARRFDKHRWGNVFVGALQKYFETVRDVNRFLSTLSFQISLFKNADTFEVNPVDLIGLEVLRVFEPEVYQALPALKRELTDLTDGSPRGNREETKKTILALVDRASEKQRETVRELLKQLFPPAEWAFGGSHYGTSFAETWFRDLRVCAEDAFDRYFHLTIPHGDISQADLERILSLTSNRDQLRQALLDLRSGGQLEIALDRLEAYKETIDVQHAEPFITALFDVGDDLSSERGGLFQISPAMHAERIIYWYLKKEPVAEVRGQTLLAAVRTTTGLTLPVAMTKMVEELAEKKDGESSEFIPANQIVELKAACVAKLEAAAENGTLVRDVNLPALLYRWKDWSGAAGPQAFCERLASSANGVLSLLRAFVVHSTSHGMSDYVSQQRAYIRARDLESFIAPERLESALSALTLEQPRPEDLEVVELFRKAMNRRRKGKSDDDPFARFDD